MLRTSYITFVGKLREGISSSRRCDSFATEGADGRSALLCIPCSSGDPFAVYETSLHLSIIFSSSKQTESVLSHLLPQRPVQGATRDLEEQISETATRPSEASSLTLSHWTITLTLLYTLVVNYPSQRRFYEMHQELSATCGMPSPLDQWLKSVARTLHRGHPFQLAQIVRVSYVEGHLPLPSDDAQTASFPHLPSVALECLLDNIQGLSRQSSWRILMSAYREFGLPVGDTRTWLSSQLILEKSSSTDLDEWLREREEKGEISRKEGTIDRWVVELKR